jgi:FlaA1/EpsC-like NDP-sugar epimerase
MLAGRIDVHRLRKVQIEDLLHREAVHIDYSQVRTLLHGRRVMVTGGGGSIGSELCRRIALCEPAELCVLGHGENSLYIVGQELRRAYPDLSLRLAVADIRDRARLDQILRECKSEIIFHAAAHKHVPLMEDNVEEAVTNNILGTRTLLEVAMAHDVERFVMISTDKAVNPTSVMGVTKRVAELLVHDAALRSGRAYVAVRFGNVLGSRGSVVPLFEKQIAQGGPVTVTHAEVKRYFMTIPEAVQLVLQASALGKGGEIFVLDMGEPIKIVDLARDMIELSGLEPGRDIDIEFTGLRPGEKLFEEISRNDERYQPTAHEKILVCRNGMSRDEVESRAMQGRVDALLDAVRACEPDRFLPIVWQLVPEYTPTPKQAPLQESGTRAERSTESHAA